MITDDIDTGWRQHYPTYVFSDRDIALEEYKVAAKTLESEERIFLNASNITLVASAALGSLAVGSSEKLTSTLDGIIPNYAINIALLLMLFVFSFISLKYFADRQKSINIASRKLVTLRVMLGLSYGRIQLVLPNWRVEGADQPLAIKLFPGWFSYAAYPFWILLVISSFASFFLCSSIIKNINQFIVIDNPLLVVTLLTIFWSFFIALVYRHALLDNHETLRLLFGKAIAKFINLPLVYNFEYVIYRSKLAVYECDRHKIKFDNLKKMLVHIEDKRFYKHSGVSYLAILRGLLGLVKLKRKSGGSTITQQLTRTLFIYDLQKTKRRKIIEIILAPWLNSVLPKDQILSMYLSSVRFEYKCFGVLSAMHYYFGAVIKNPTMAESFFLIERVSNIRSSLLTNKIIATVKSAKSDNLLSSEDILTISDLYQRAVGEGTIIDRDETLAYLVTTLREL
ncbi:biosynthetic peptidoglycan transglycosylase [Photobacterium ganghwense]|uniref:biosynthetic peptidoglycan transglycosylase n=1 Tax=Photobacterium ganghwense TaxID=320778 RepID=UPI001C2DE84F|nr:biosynthetic peptidoglycan transglycosylase [Photobacterium ganghwense]MBV1842919.1 transglycosylase domain-containing protein [Photobacterium ganghwense]